MLLIYLNDYIDENHASPAAYVFFLKLFTFLQYPMLTFHYFHPFHPAVSVSLFVEYVRDALVARLSSR
jgi:hypothetical protein